MRRCSILTSGGVLLVASLACSTTEHPPPSSQGHSSTITIGVPEGGDNNSADIGFRQMEPIFTLEGLTARSLDGRPQPRIVQSWRVAADGLTWRLILRKDVLFHDGSKCDAETVKQILTVALRSPEASLYPGLLDISGLRTEGDTTLVVELRRPSAFLLDDLYIQITKQAPDGKTIGTGPYFTARASSGEIELHAHRGYSQGTPRIDKIVLKSYPTLRQAWASLLRNEIDVVSNLSGDAQEFLTSETIQAFSFQRHYAYVMAFNSQRPSLRQPSVRRALNTAVNRDAIIQSVLKGRGRAAYGPIWPNHWAYDASVPPYTYDASLARATLDAVGVKPANGSKSNVRFRFQCLVPRDHSTFERLALLLQQQMYEVGVDLELESLPLSELNRRLRAGQYDAALLDLASGPSLSRAYVFWHSPGEFPGLNVFGYRNADADRWLDRLRFAPDEAATRTATSQLQRVMLEDPPAVFLAWNERSRAVSRRLVIEASAGQDPFQSLSKWRLADQR